MSGFVYNDEVVKLTIDGGDAKFLTHLQLVTEVRFQADLGFQVGLIGSDGAGGSLRNFYWFHPSIPLKFFYDEPGQIDFDQDYYDTMLEMAQGPFGVFLGEVRDLPLRFPQIEEEAPAPSE
ncbi:DUF7882 family protein [Nocardia camponoti]|uniref:DUF7882 domain-containing protein n=1 Tax=Nocardia camponoti TaxID=1616106 RepID=A0A917Q7E5_9NOCA|nr:hypothetical protein [Nocardia camponoti]GGK33052.1 hypothetical protein GCM10011591_00880 [Nocardia camponoti]